DTVIVNVNAAPNQPPMANAGPDIIITLPVNSVTLSGIGSDADGAITAYLWRKISGPSQYTIISAEQAKTSLNNHVQGESTFELRVTDNQDATARDTMTLTVKAANLSPTANAGADISITLPTNTANLSGSGSDPDGTIASYQWTKISGPSQYSIANSIQAQTT